MVDRWSAIAGRIFAGVGVLVAGCGAELTIDTLALPSGRVGLAYDARLEASGPVERRWSLADGELPPGLSLSRGGRIAGTPEASGRFEVVLEASSGSVSDTKALVLQIGEGRPLTLHTTRLSEAVLDTPYRARLEASGGVRPYRWSVTAGALPDGLAFSADRDRAGLVGTPKVVGRFEFALEVRDDRGASVTRQVSLLVSARRVPIRIDTDTFASGYRGRPYRAEVVSGGGAGETLKWDLTEGSLPPGLSLAADGTPATTVTGTPTRAGTFDFTVTVIEASGGTVSRSLRIEVGSDPVRFATRTLPTGEVGQAYTATLSVDGGTGGRARVRLARGRLPQGLELAGGRIRGTPVSPDRKDLVFEVSDEAGTATVGMSLEVLGALELASAPLPEGEAGARYAASLSVGGTAGLPRFEVDGLPPGLETRTEGVSLFLEGVPTNHGVFMATIATVDGRGRRQARDARFVIHPRLAVATEVLPGGKLNEAYEAQLSSSGGLPGPRRWSSSGAALPPGLGLDARTGRLVGTVTSSGSFSLVFEVQGISTATRAFTLEIEGPPPPPKPVPIQPAAVTATTALRAAPPPAAAPSSPPPAPAPSSATPAPEPGSATPAPEPGEPATPPARTSTSTSTPAAAAPVKPTQPSAKLPPPPAGKLSAPVATSSTATVAR